MLTRRSLLCAAAAVASRAQSEPAIERDIVYARYGERQLRLDLYVPTPRPSKPVAGIVTVRGGGWRQGDKNGFARIASALAREGFAAACIEYRTVPEWPMTAPVEDVKAAVRWLRAEGPRRGVRPDAIGAIGGSAGGHLVCMLGASFKAAALEGDGGHAGVSSRVQAVVAMAPVVDLARMGRRPGAPAPELLARLSPVTYVDKDSAPTLLIHSDADRTVPHAQSGLMQGRLRAVGVRCELVTIPGAPHAFWNGEKWSANVLRRAAAFFHETLG